MSQINLNTEAAVQSNQATRKNWGHKIRISRFGFEGLTICAATSLILVACAQSNLTSPYGLKPLAKEPVEVVSTEVVQGTKVQTAYGLMNLGQIINVDGKNLYVSASGLLPVERDMPIPKPDNQIKLSKKLGSLAANSKPSSISSMKRKARSVAPKMDATASVNRGGISTKPTKKSKATVNKSSEPQYVMLAFDGSRSLDMWQDTRKFAREMDINFTYFVSGVYFLNESNKSKYKGPGKKAGVSHIGWAKDGAEVGQRLEQLNAAVSEGHEIASHANGHFDGSKWTKKQWRSEISQFHSIMKNAYSNNGLAEPQDWRHKVKTRMFKGFRAPLLGVSSGLNSVLREFGYTYDTSRTANMSYWPKKNGGVYNFPLGHVQTAHGGVHTLSMDYNFYVAQSKGKPMPSKAKAFEDEMYETYMNYFRNNYRGNRAPVQIGHHFSLWNDGAYWKAMKRFAREVCGKPDVRCATYSELKQYMDYRGNKGVEVASR